VEINVKTASILLLAASGISGATGTYAGGSRAEDRVKDLESKVTAISENQVEVMTTQRIILGQIGKINNSADDARESDNEQDRKLERIITILEEREN
jgi:hypothetical protein